MPPPAKIVAADEAAGSVDKISLTCHTVFKMHPKEISISDFTYDLPEEKIATHPLQKRDDSKLLVYKDGNISQSFYHYLPELLSAQSLMVFNNTKVVEARLLFQKETGGVIEIFCLEPHEKYADITTAMNQTGSVQWLCLVGGASKWKSGLVLEKGLQIGSQSLRLEAKYVEKRTDCFVIELSWNDDRLSFAEILHYAGKVPLPPYIKRDAELSDAERYQTVYANFDGSVAAPTAGLHFTKEIFEALKTKGIETGFVTLHVGAGTFKPVKSERMHDHEMHAEFIEVENSFIEKLIANAHKKVIAVGTTSLRTIESLYWLGCKLLQNPKAFEKTSPFLEQWEAYDLNQQNYSVEDALNAVLDHIKNKNHNALLAKTQIIIAPGYQFKIAEGLITNFHQPSSTLLLLVAAFIGNDWRKVYDYALKNDFRFLSYGDGSLLWKNTEKAVS